MIYRSRLGAFPVLGSSVMGSIDNRQSTIRNAFAFSETETETETVEALLSPFLGDASLSGRQLQQLTNYLDLLLRWNARMNLTAVRDPEQIVARHFGESLFAARHLYSVPGTQNSQLLDLGSGAGFPGLPIKIWAPDLHVTLLESNQRKSTFLREVIRSLELSSIEVVTTRAEDFKISATDDSKLSATETDDDSNLSTAEDPYLSKVVGPGSLAGDAPRLTQNTAAAGAPPPADVTLTLRAVEHFDSILPIAVNLLTNAKSKNRRLALLIGASQVATARRLASTLAWSDPIAIPQSSQRVLLVGTMR